MRPNARHRSVVATRPMVRRRRRRRALVALGITTALVAGTGYGAWQYIEQNEYLLDERCEVALPEQVQRLSPSQAHSAAMISVSAVDRELPPQAAVHAVGISLQESELTVRQATNERDSRVLFARGARDWSQGASAQVAEASIDGFYDMLEERWAAEDADAEEEQNEDPEQGSAWTPELSLDEAAEALDRPHNPSFYPQHTDRARAFALPLVGQQPVVMSCTLPQLDAPEADPQGLTEELVALMPNALGVSFTEAPEGQDDDEEFEPEPVLDGVVDLSGEGPTAEMVIHVPERSGDYDYLWMVAHWAVAAAYDYGVQSVAAGPYEWNRDSGIWERQETVSDDAVVIGFSRD